MSYDPKKWLAYVRERALADGPNAMDGQCDCRSAGSRELQIYRERLENKYTI